MFKHGSNRFASQPTDRQTDRQKRTHTHTNKQTNTHTHTNKQHMGCLGMPQALLYVPIIQPMTVSLGVVCRTIAGMVV